MIYVQTDNPLSVQPGESLTLFDGTETAEAGLTSRAFARGTQGSSDNGASYYAYGMPADCVVAIQGSNDNVDGHYTEVGTLTIDANGNGFFNETGRAAFYRARLKTFGGASPDLMPVVTVQR